MASLQGSWPLCQLGLHCHSPIPRGRITILNPRVHHSHAAAARLQLTTGGEFDLDVQWPGQSNLSVSELTVQSDGRQRDVVTHIWPQQ